MRTMGIWEQRGERGWWETCGEPHVADGFRHPHSAFRVEIVLLPAPVAP